MRYALNQPIVLIVNGEYFNYVVSSKHRTFSATQKSKWTLPVNDEVNCFKKSIQKRWKVDGTAWGLHIDSSNTICTIGKSKNGDDLKIAKFIDRNIQNSWHGYPANHIRNTQDRPDVKILLSWRNLGYIKKHHVSKIRAGKTCNL